MAHEIDPEGLRYSLNEIWDRHQKQIFVVENGLGAYDRIDEDGKVRDDYRIDYLRQHIIQMHEAVLDGVDLRGYTPWAASTWSAHRPERWQSAMDLSLWNAMTTGPEISPEGERSLSSGTGM